MNIFCKRLLNLSLLLFFANGMHAVQFRHLSVKDGLSQLSVISIYEDQLGRMWFGTEEGLNVYDGWDIISLKENTDKFQSGSRISHIVGDGLDNLYFVAGNSLVNYNLKNQKFRCLQPRDVHCTYMKGNILYYGLRNSLYSLDPRTKKRHQLCYFANTHVRTLIVDHAERLWIGTTSGLYIKDKGLKMQRMIAGVNVSNLYEDSRHEIWVSTRSDGCYVFDNNGHKKHFMSSHVHSWITSPKNENERNISRQISSNQVRGVAEDMNGRIWIGTFAGLNEYDPQSGLFTLYTHSDHPNSLSHSSVYPVYRSSKGYIWVGTYYGGVNYFDPSREIFTFYPANIKRLDCLSYPFVGHLAEDRQGAVWICTEGGGLNRLDPRSGHFTHYLMQDDGNAIAHNNLKNILYDKNTDKLYIGTHTGGISVYSIPTGRFQNIFQEHPEYKQRYGDKVYDMKFHQNDLFFTTQKGLFKMDLTSQKIMAPFKHRASDGNTNFCIDRNEELWMAAEDGIWRISIRNPRKRRLYKLNEHGLKSSVATDIMTDCSGQIYVTTLGDGFFVYRRKEDHFRNFNCANSPVISNFCYEMENARDQVIMNSDQGISIFNKIDSSFYNLELSPDFPLEGINRGNGILVSPEGMVYVGGTNGLLSFHLIDLIRKPAFPGVFLSRLFVNNREVTAGDSTEILHSALFDTKKLILNHDQNDLTVCFTSCDYSSNSRHRIFEYKLEGYDRDWAEARNNRISYTKVSPGVYRLIIREKGSDNQPVVCELPVTIRAPFYWSPLAWFMYLLAIALGLYAYYRFKRARLILEHSLELERKDKKNIEDLNRAKLMFFTSVSHEFRTPLTLIIAELHSIVSGSLKPSGVHRAVENVYDNAIRLLRLVNELLDFRKIGETKMSLHVERKDIAVFASTILSSFEAYARSHQVTCLQTKDQAENFCYFDPKQMEKVIFNLLSNAFKYVEDGCGRIELHVSNTADIVSLSVTDNGIGIGQADLDRIFERYYQSESNLYKIAASPGTGIGLALAKDIIELHHGTIDVKSAPGYGSIFTIRLHASADCFTPEELAPLRDTSSPHTESIVRNVRNYSPDTPEIPDGDSSDPVYKILIAEDEEEMLQTLVRIFRKTCSVITARNGAEGLQLTRTEHPDLVLSDIMMPVLNGIEMCRQIKDDINICHIPVVLLTAMVSTEQTIHGLEIGADEYIAKPFNPDVLLAKCNSIVRARLLVRKRFAGTEDSDDGVFTTNSLDRKFLLQCNSFLQDHIYSSTITVDDLADSVHMGRTSFYQKMKSLTGLTPNDYIMNFRLRKSAELLKKDAGLSVSDIAFQLGFSSPKYFAMCFKSKYGVTPTDYRKS